MSGSKALMFRLDLALFVATASALTGYYRYKQRQPVRRASTRLHVSFGDAAENPTSDAGVPAAVSLSLLEELYAVSSSSLALSTKTRPILGLLFAASWCPDCNNASGVVSAVGRVVAAAEQHTVDIVYVSSDTSETELLQFKPPSMRHVPFDNIELRTALKRQFRTCANREVGEVLLGTHISRLHGIPTLILLDTSTGKVLTTNGVEDVMKADSPSQVLSKWKGMLEQDTGK